MDVVLVQPRQRLSRGPNRPLRRGSTPLGLLTIATPLDVAGYKVRIIHQETEADWEESLLAELKTKPICVGMTAMTGPPLWWALKASEIVKRNSDAPVVWGGVHASLLPQQTLENPYIDIVVQGEGEETFFELVRALGNRQPLDKVKGIWYKDGGQIKQTPARPFIDLNQQPPLSYHLIDLEKHVFSGKRSATILFETSRGCPFDCTFCYNTSFNNRRWRPLTADQTLFRIKRLKEEYGVKGLAFSDDNFFTDPNRAYQIIEGFVRQKFDINWNKGDIRLDLLSRLDDDYLRLMEQSGCDCLVVGLESGSQKIADLMRKQIDLSQAIPVNRRMAQYGMDIRYLFLAGVPGETEADMAETASLMVKLLDDNEKAIIGVQICVPYPGTELFDLCVRHGLEAPQKLEDWIPLSWSNRRLDYPWLSAKAKKLLQMISFCAVFAMKEKDIREHALDLSPVISLVAKVYHPIARRRLQGPHYSFFPEMKIAELLGYKGY